MTHDPIGTSSVRHQVMSRESQNMHTDVEKITPYGGEESKGRQIEQAFDTIAPRYDFMNRLLSMGIDVTWRKRALKSLTYRPSRILDLATGTGDLAVMEAKLFPESKITGVDLSEEMLAIARAKSRRNRVESRIDFSKADCLALPFEESSFDLATIAFGIRNFEDIPAGLKEMLRVLKPGGRVLIVELSRPEPRLLSSFYNFYLTKVTPALGTVLTGKKKEYKYLPESIGHVPQGETMLGLMQGAGFKKCRFQTYTFGICSCYTAVKEF